MSTLAWALLSAAVSFALWYKLTENRRENPQNLPLPPGPPPLPLIGNMLDMPKAYPWLTYADWAKKYGPVIHAKVLDKHVVVLNTLEAVNDLFEKRSSIYSSRPRMPMVNELMGWTWSFGLMKYGPRWREQRKAFHRHFQSSAVLKYRPTQLTFARSMLVRLVDDPDEFMQISRFTLASTIIKTVYGFDVLDVKDPFVANAEAVLNSLDEAGIPGAFLVDTFPILKYIPAWFPLAGFKRKAASWKGLLRDFVDKPFDDVMMHLEKGTGTMCVVADMVESCKETIESDNSQTIAKGVAASAYAGGTDATVATVQTFFLAMATHLDIQHKAQEQIDAVTGRTRLPEFADLESLPYVRAIVMELLRAYPTIPIGVAHATTEDDEYKGNFIPKGSIVLGNVCLLLHDESVYPDPMSFKPDRFIRADGSYNTDVRSPTLAAFGFGRRVCPGQHFALDSVLIIIANVLAAFNIEIPNDDDGGTVRSPPEIKMSSGLSTHPIPFRCKIVQRSHNTVKLIQQARVTADA